MVARSFKVNKRDFERSPTTIFQRKLRIFLNCFTIRDMLVDDINSSVIFKKNHKINGVKMQDPKEYIVKYETSDSDDPKQIILKLMI